MIAPGAGVRVYLACGRTDMRKGLDGLAMLVQQVFGGNPFEVRSTHSAAGGLDRSSCSGTTVSGCAC